jgi:hypothetical protein
VVGDGHGDDVVGRFNLVLSLAGGTVVPVALVTTIAGGVH